jgi:hypothetical protein
MDVPLLSRRGGMIKWRYRVIPVITANELVNLVSTYGPFDGRMAACA